MWFWIWTALVIGAIAALVAVMWSLWPKAKALYAAVETAGNQLDRLADRIAELDAEPRPQPRPVTAFGDIDSARAHLQERDVVRTLRRAARQLRHQERFEVWRTFNL